jgi:hypothetical protein
MRRIPIRQKLAAAMAVPLVALVAVVSIEVRATISERDDVRDQAELARATIGPDGLISAIETEALFAAASTVGNESSLGLPVADAGQSRR